MGGEWCVCMVTAYRTFQAVLRISDVSLQFVGGGLITIADVGWILQELSNVG